MKNPSKIVSLIALVLVIAPCVLYFAGVMGLDATKFAALVGTVGWFIATPFWMWNSP